MEVSKEQLREHKFRNGNVISDFRAYCSCVGSCDECNPRVRFWCRIRNAIETHQIKIINRICK